MLLVISKSGHYIWYIYLNFPITQTDECELGLLLLMCWRWKGILSSVSSCFSVRNLQLSNSLVLYKVIFHWLLAMFWLPNTQTIYWAIQDSFNTYYCVNILHNICPEIIIMSSLTQQLFNSGYDKWLPFKKIHNVATRYYFKR